MPKSKTKHEGKPRSEGRGKGNRLKSLSRRLDERVLALRFYEALDTPVSLSCYLLLKYGEEKQLVEKGVDPSDYQTPLSYFKDAQAVALLSKYPFLRTGIDIRQVALDKFVECEEQCRLTNERLQRYSDEKAMMPPRVANMLNVMRRKISDILGDVPEWEDLDFRFGPGANYGVRGETSVYNKLVADLECSRTMLPIVGEFLGEFPGWIQPGNGTINVVPGSELTFVPKSAKTMRPIAIEPGLNGLMQKGIGSHLRIKLQQRGVDLDDQTHNQKLAERALQRGLVTVDLASASDTVSTSVVLELLPIDWVELLDTCRCSHYVEKTCGEWKEFHKFSSMGNAYTFELESLIFYAAAIAACEEADVYWSKANVGVYGDDIIVPQVAFEPLKEVLAFLGFTVNTEKTHSTGPFRESCGKDYFLGCDVRPLHLRKRVSNHMDVYYVANSIKRIAQRWANLDPNAGWGLAKGLKRTYEWVISHLHRHHKVFGPEGYGDGHLISDFDQACPTQKRQRAKHKGGWEGWTFTTYQMVAKLHTVEDGWPKAYALYHAGMTIPNVPTYASPKPTRFKAIKTAKAWNDWVVEPSNIGERIREMWDLGGEFVVGNHSGLKSEGYTVRAETRIKKCRTLGRDWPNLGPWTETA